MAQYPKRSTNNFFLFFLIIAGIVAVIFILENLIPILIFSGIGYGIYYAIKKEKTKQQHLASSQLNLLKDDLRKAENDYFRVQELLKQDKKSEAQYGTQHILKELQHISFNLQHLQKHIPTEEFIQTSQTIQKQINMLKAIDAPTPSEAPVQPQNKEEMIVQMAPEILEFYQNIQKDHAAIIKKIKNAPNAAELEVMHRSAMERFEDIIETYLRIKESPKDFYMAQERLEKAKLAIQQFDADLDENLRQLNENEMTQFEISLRLMSQKSQ
ncbi:hypothetical protein ACVR1I_07360 [Streptococcus cameli]